MDSHIVKRVIAYSKNGIVNINDIDDFVLKRLVSLPKVMKYVKEQMNKIDYDLLIPYQVDCPKKQLKRQIKYRFGDCITLNDMQGTYEYKEIKKHGKPHAVLSEMGFTVFSKDEVDLMNRVRPFIETGLEIPRNVRYLVNRFCKRHRTDFKTLLDKHKRMWD